MADQSLYEQLQSLQKAEGERLVRNLEIQLKEPETKRARSGRDTTYLNWQYRDPSAQNPVWKNRSTPIFTEEAKLLLANGPYEQGQLYQVSAKKNEQGYWQWNSIESTNLRQQQGNDQENNGQQNRAAMLRSPAIQRAPDQFDAIEQNKSRSRGLER